MPEIYLTLDEAAGLEGITYDAMKKKIARNPELYSTKTEKNTAGGKERVFVALSSLSIQARRKYAKQVKAEEERKTCGTKINLAELEAFVGTQKYRELIRQAEEDAKPVEEFLKYDHVWGDNQKKEIAERIAEQFNISARTLYRWTELYRQGGTVMLIRLPNKFLKRTYTGRPSVPKEVEELIRAEYLQLNGARPSHIVTKAQTYCQLRGLDSPSKDTVYRLINDINKYEPDLVCLAREGEEAYNKKFAIKATREDPVYANQVWEGDHHRCDFFIEYNGKAYRPWMTIWFDVCTRTVRGYTLALSASGRTITMALRHGVLRKRLPAFKQEDLREEVFSAMARLGWLPEKLEELSGQETPLTGLPAELYIDNGEDYKAAVKKGLKHKNWEYSSEIRSTCQALDIKVRFCTKYSPWAKGHCERFFGTFTDQFSRYMPGYCGKDNKHRPEGLDEQAMAERGELLTLEEAYMLAEYWIHKYHNTVHSSLGMTPYEKVKKAALARTEMPDEREFDICLMESDKATVTASGIRRFGTQGRPRYYWHDDLDEYIGQDVVIRYDPNHIGELLVFDPKLGGKYICTATNDHALTFDASQDDIKMHRKKTASRRKQLKEALRGAQSNTLEAVIMERRKGGSRTVSGETEHQESNVRMLTPMGKVARQKASRSAENSKSLPKAANESPRASVFEDYLINAGKQISNRR